MVRFTKCKLCEKNTRINTVHNFKFIKIYKCSNCDAFYAGKNYYCPKIFDWGEEKKELKKYYIPNFERLGKEYFKLLNKLKIKSPGKILDIGCGPGTFLNIAKKKGWKVTGIEPSKKLCNFAKKNYKLCLINNVFKKKYFKKKKFHVITIFDVLEHIKNPKEFIINLHNFILPKGYLIITTPNYSSLTIKLCILVYYLSFKRIVIPVKMITQAEYNYHHLFYFTNSSLIKLLNKAGLIPVYKNTTSTIPQRYFFNRKEFTNISFFWKKLLSLSLSGLQMIETILNKQDTIFIIAQKR